MGARVWTAERIEQLKVLWPTGVSARQIAASLGAGLTRNAIIGKVHRLGLVGPERPEPKVARIPRERRPSLSVVGQHDIKPCRIRALPTIGATALRPMEEPDFCPDGKIEPLRLVDIPKGGPVSLMMLSDKTCRWPIGDPGDDDFCFCGVEPVYDSVYCPYHHHVAYTPVPLTLKVQRKLAALDGNAVGDVG